MHNLRASHRRTVLTIGNFDGVHRGHQAILEQLSAVGRRLGLPTTLMTFEPHPREFFSPGHAPPRLTRLREKLVELASCDLDRVWVLRFDETLSSMPAARFIDDLLVERLGVECVVMGDEFRFGHRAEGSFELMRDAGERRGFEVVRHATYPVRGQRASSSSVRELLAHGDLSAAAELLGRRYSMCGRVTYGEALGRTLGYATANIRLRRVAPPLHGIFAVRVHGLGAGALPGMASIGNRPTIGGTETLLEVHLFDFDRDIYRREVRVEFVAKLREEECYDGLDALKVQLDRDAEAAREALRAA